MLIYYGIQITAAYQRIPGTWTRSQSLIYIAYHYASLYQSLYFISLVTNHIQNLSVIILDILLNEGGFINTMIFVVVSTGYFESF